MDPNIPASIVGKVLKPAGVVSAAPVATGMSGARVFHCQGKSGTQFSLKRWPDGTSRSRIREVHQVIQESRRNGCSIVPEVHEVAELEDIFTCHGGHWELLEWKPGKPATGEATLNDIEQGAAAIAQFHASVRSMGKVHQVAPAVTARFQRVQQLNSLIPHAIERSKQAIDPVMETELRDACQMLRLNWCRAESQIVRSLGPYLHREISTQYVLRDVHREHILFHEDRVSGLIDFDAIRVDCPATDLARWVGSFLVGRADSKIVWEAGMAGFCGKNPYHPRSGTKWDPKMAVDLCFATTWISLANWVVWVLCERRTFPAGPEAAAGRIRELMAAASLDI